MELTSGFQHPSPWRVLRIWLGIGAQSFGGGAATLFLIRRAAVEEQRWLSDEEFNRHWAICQVAPGINLLALTVLIGRRTGGALGIALALLGLLLPSVGITLLLTALYTGARELPTVQAGLRGVVPATVGLGLLLSWQMGRPLLAESRANGRVSLFIGLLILIGSGAALLLFNPPVIAILLGGGALGALAAFLKAETQKRRGAEDGTQRK